MISYENFFSTSEQLQELKFFVLSQFILKSKHHLVLLVEEFWASKSLIIATNFFLLGEFCNIPGLSSERLNSLPFGEKIPC